MDFITKTSYLFEEEIRETSINLPAIIYRLYDEKEGNTGFISPRKPMYRRPERAARWRLFWFPR